MGIKAIDGDAFNAIYEGCADSVYYTALRYSGNHHVAEEISQTVFMELYANLGTVNDKAVTSWLLTSAKHMALNYKRGLKREVLCGDFMDDENEAYAADADLEEDFIRKLYEEGCKELTDNVFSDLYHLNPRWYSAITTTYFLEKPQKEVAEIMGVSLEVLHGMLYRARKWIRKNYREQYNHLHEE